MVYLTDSTGAIEFQSTTLLDKVYGARVDTGIMEGIRYNQDTKNYTYTIQPVDSSAADNGTAYTVESTTDYSDLFAMNVTVLHKDDSAMMIRVNEGGTVVEGVVGDISGLRNDHFNTSLWMVQSTPWTTPPRIGTTSGALLVVTTSTTSGASGLPRRWCQTHYL